MAFLRFAVFFHPGHGSLEFFVVVYAEIHASEYFHQRNVFSAHAEVVLQEICIHYGTCYSHAGVAHGQITFAAHCCNGLCCTRKAEYLFCHVGGNGVVGEVLDVVSVDAEGGKPFLGVCCENCGEIYSPGALSAVETPYGLWPVGVHVHCFGSIAPA